MSTIRTVTVTGPEDLEGGWFVVDGEVERLEDVEWERPGRGQPELPEGQRKALRAGDHRFTVGQTVELADGAALDEGFRDSVRSLWRRLIIVVTSPAVFGLVHLVPTPLEPDSMPERVLFAVVSIPVVCGIVGVWHGLTRKADGRVTRAMAGAKMREAHDRQRGVGAA
ncbi:hypothetical protein [Curtobacterium sp. MCBD17_008]|uniref:hypothetical protein n=1 Tax=Curtobacterium sp. MCBD17_008 TaxID=2175656 RepID=UPI000DAA0F5F|nr:hypothetical protein [Curtobacterium sp. MCBD17_008]PZE94153.1 hypothetical protein DEI95_05870 [Curtobacterium sp. MCBD17_008]